MGNTISNLTAKCIPEYGNDDELLSEEKPGQQQLPPTPSSSQPPSSQQVPQQVPQQPTGTPQNVPKPQEKHEESDEAIFKVTSQEGEPKSSVIVEESYGMAPISAMQRPAEKQKSAVDEDDIFKDMEPEIKKPLTIHTQKSMPQTSDRLRLEITQEDQEDTSGWD